MLALVLYILLLCLCLKYARFPKDRGSPLGGARLSFGNKLCLLVVLSSTPKRGRLKEHLLSPCVLMLTTIQSSALTLPKMCRKPTPKESSRKVEPNASFHCWPEVPVPGPVLPLGTSGAQFRSHFRLFSQVLEPWSLPKFGLEVETEVPVHRKYR